MPDRQQIAADGADRGFIRDLWTDPRGQWWEDFTHATDVERGRHLARLVCLGNEAAGAVQYRLDSRGSLCTILPCTDWLCRRRRNLDDRRNDGGDGGGCFAACRPVLRISPSTKWLPSSFPFSLRRHTSPTREF